MQKKIPLALKNDAFVIFKTCSVQNIRINNCVGIIISNINDSHSSNFILNDVSCCN